MIREFRNEGNQSIERFFDANYQGERSVISNIPEEEELNNCTNVLNLELFNIIDKVYEDASNCIMRMKGNSDNDRILYRRTVHSLQKKHSNRIIDSHRGVH